MLHVSAALVYPCWYFHNFWHYYCTLSLSHCSRLMIPTVMNTVMWWMKLDMDPRVSISKCWNPLLTQSTITCNHSCWLYKLAICNVHVILEVLNWGRTRKRNTRYSWKCFHSERCNMWPCLVKGTLRQQLNFFQYRLFLSKKSCFWRFPLFATNRYCIYTHNFWQSFKHVHALLSLEQTYFFDRQNTRNEYGFQATPFSARSGVCRRVSYKAELKSDICTQEGQGFPKISVLLT